MVVTTFFRTGKLLSLTMIARHETDRIIAAPREAKTKTQAAPNGSGTSKRCSQSLERLCLDKLST